MAYKSLLTVVTAADTDPAGAPGPRFAALRAAVAMARAEDAHLDVVALGVDRTQIGYFYAGASGAVYREMIERAQAESAAAAEAVRAVLAPEDIRWAAHPEVGQSGAVSGIVARHARFADLALLRPPYGTGRGPEEEAILEALLFDGECPTLVLPEGMQDAPRTDRVMIAWNESAEALAAVRRALPILQRARKVEIVVIDPRPSGPDLPDPGVNLSQLLARHGVGCDVMLLARSLPSVADVLARHIRDHDIDMLVMGAYGHSRFREAILGGATRSFLRDAPVPVFMMH
ncbi:MAG: universal stress protein [Alphaproteobacteria bacterium]|nr:universal stress protein [Alphaproteobacteria bacterium]